MDVNKQTSFAKTANERILHLLKTFETATKTRDLAVYLTQTVPMPTMRCLRALKKAEPTKGTVSFLYITIDILQYKFTSVIQYREKCK